jgi:hypothetical protein
MAYPKHAVRAGDGNVEIVKQVQARLDAAGCGPLADDGIFGAETESAVKLFQTRRGLAPDGVVGPLTWDDLFQEAAVVVSAAPSPLAQATLDAAGSQDGVRETPGQPNRGPEVDGYVRSLGLDPTHGYSWCQAFVYWSFTQAATKLGVANPCIKTAGVLEHWARSPVARRVYADKAFDDPTLVRPGAVFIIDHGAGKGHAGLVTQITAGEIQTIEGNTNAHGSREGDGVYRKTRAIGSINVGFIDYGS